MPNFLAPAGKTEKKKKIGIKAAIAFLSLAGVFLIVKPAKAWFLSAALGTVAALIAVFGIGEVAETILEKAAAIFVFFFYSLLKGLINLLGELFLSITNQVVKVAEYNNFLKSTAVETGWVVVRDVGNMFFVIVLLIIAIATILRVEAYSYKKLLPKLLLMAVLINFSKTICGIIIDFGQVIMLTFVNAWKAAAGANFVQAFGIEKVYEFGKAEEASDAGVLGSMLLAVMILLVAFATVLTFLIVLVIRIIAIWLLIILSPLAFLLASFPGGESYAKDWWSNFTKYVLVGPLLAFFLWLSLIVAGGGKANEEVGVVSLAAEGSVQATQGALGSLEKLSSFIVATCLLLVALVMTQKLGIVGSGVAGAALSGLRRAGTAPLRLARKGVSWGFAKTKERVKKGYHKAADVVYGATGFAAPLSRARAERTKMREEALHRDRMFKGQAVSAERVMGARGRVGLMASMIMDPGTWAKTGLWGQVRAVVAGGGSKFAERARQYAELGKRKATLARASENPIDTFKEEKGREYKEAKRLADEASELSADKEEKANKLSRGLNNEQKAVFDSEGVEGVLQLNAQRVDLENEVAQCDLKIQQRETEERMAQGEIDRIDQNIEVAEREKTRLEGEGRGRGDPDWDGLTARIQDLQRRRGEAVDKRDKATESKRVAMEEKAEAEKDLGTVKDRMKFDGKMEEVIKVHIDAKQAREKAMGHRKKASELRKILDKPEAEIGEMAREWMSKLWSTIGHANSVLSASTEEQRAALEDILNEAKATLARQLGREATDEEVKEELRRRRFAR